MEKILVIGSNSFSGSSFTSYLIDNGFEVHGVSRSPQPVEAMCPYLWGKNPNQFKFYQIDLNEGLIDLLSLIKREKLGRIYNFAAQSMVGQSWDIPEDWMRTNVLSFNMLLNGLLNVDFLERYVHVTTPEVYGNTQGFVTEGAEFSPSTPYAVSRAAADMSINCFNKFKGFPFCGTRASNVYGPGQQLYRIIPKVIHSILSGQKMTLDGGGVSQRNFIHMLDVSKATEKIMMDGKDGEYYHISGKEMISIRSLVEKICDLMKANFYDHVELGAERTGKDGFYMLDSQKLKKELGWSDEISLEEGLNTVVDWMHHHWDSLKTAQTIYEHKK